MNYKCIKKCAILEEINNIQKRKQKNGVAFQIESF